MPSDPPLPFRWLLTEGPVRAAVVGDVFLNAWVGAPTAAAMRSLGDTQIAWQSSLPRMAALTLVDPRAGFKVDDGLKREGARISDSMRGLCYANATVVEERGFRASMARSIISAIEFISRPSYPVEVFQSMNDAAAFIAAHAGEADPTAKVAVIVEAAGLLRQGIAPRDPST